MEKGEEWGPTAMLFHVRNNCKLASKGSGGEQMLCMGKDLDSITEVPVKRISMQVM